MTAIQCQPKRTIRFYGPLAKVLNRRSFSAVALNSASEVMRCLLSNFPQLVSHMRGRHYRVVMNGRAISKDELNDPVGDNHEIHIIPAICGAGGGGPLTSILAGVALIGAGLLFPFAAPFLTPLGIGLALQGVAELISPTPDVDPESTDPSNRSYNFSNIQQTSREGVPVPLVYGEIVTGSVVLSVNIERDDEKLGTGDGEGVFEPGIGDNTYNLAERYPGICWAYYSEVYYKFDTNCPCPAPSYPNCTTTPYTASFTMFFNSPNDSNPGGWFRATTPTAEAINLLTLAGDYCSAAFRGYRFFWTELQRCSDGDEIDDDRQWEATSPAYAYKPIGYRVWQGPAPLSDGTTPENIPFRLIGSTAETGFTIPTETFSSNYPNNPFE